MHVDVKNVKHEMIDEKISFLSRNLNWMASKDGRQDLQDSALNEEIQSFFNSAPPLRNSSEITKKLKDFIERHSAHLGDFWHHTFLLMSILKFFKT